jgi:hypothetical protein
MTIKYQNGRTVEAIILARDSQMIRVAVKGCDDVVKLTNVNETWVTDDCEPVRIEFAWERSLRQRACMRGRLHLLRNTIIELDSYLAIQFTEQQVMNTN